jgi:hypothetical protein
MMAPRHRAPGRNQNRGTGSPRCARDDGRGMATQGLDGTGAVTALIATLSGQVEISINLNDLQNPAPVINLA